MWLLNLDNKMHLTENLQWLYRLEEHEKKQEEEVVHRLLDDFGLENFDQNGHNIAIQCVLSYHIAGIEADLNFSNFFSSKTSTSTSSTSRPSPLPFPEPFLAS